MIATIIKIEQERRLPFRVVYCLTQSQQPMLLLFIIIVQKYYIHTHTHMYVYMRVICNGNAIARPKTMYNYREMVDCVRFQTMSAKLL